MFIFWFVSQFPKFWSEVEDDQRDLIEVMSVMTILGFTTKSSLAQIKTMKAINQLECDYAKIRSNKPTEMFRRFPVLEKIDFFSPGLKRIMLNIAERFSPKVNPEDLEKIIKNKIMRLAKKVR